MAENHQTGVVGEIPQTLEAPGYGLHRKQLRTLDPRNCKLFRFPYVNPNQPVSSRDARLNSCGLRSRGTGIVNTAGLANQYPEKRGKTTVNSSAVPY
jgi:hypothetical protein